MMKQKIKRVTEIDLLRGIAILMMVYVHFLFDLKNYFELPIPMFLTDSVWSIATAFLFVLISGISACLGRKSFTHGVRVFTLALILSLITYFINPNYFIVFGILHCLGGCLLLSPLFFKRSPYFLIVFSMFFLLLGNILLKTTLNIPHLYWIGIMDQQFSSIDYYPILPWLGVFLLGIAMGKAFYTKKENRLFHPSNQNLLCMMGRHSLMIYLIHQPILLGILYVIKLITIK